MSLKVVVIGTGFGRYAAAPAYEALGCEVTLLSPRDQQAVQRAIAGPCDLVSIHSPPFMHLPLVKLAVEHGRAVLCDKPFGRDSNEAQRMLELAEQAGVLHFLNFEFRFDPQRSRLKELLDQGAIGTPQHFACTTYMSRGRYMPHGWLFEKNQGGGWIGAFASHFVDSLHWLFGDIDNIQSLPRIDVRVRKDRDPVSTARHEATAEDAVSASFRLRNGVTATLDTAFAAVVDRPPTTTLLGTEGIIELQPNGELVLYRNQEEPRTFAAEGGSNPMSDAMERWLSQVCSAVTSGQAIKPDFHSGLACARVLDAMRDV